MAQTHAIGNPFMLMLNPEVVFAAVERSERLSQLNRHLCRPLDRPVLPGTKALVEDADEADEADESDETGEPGLAQD